jgi:hypothetical protein
MFRPISLPTHSALELALGLALLIAPPMLGLGAAGLVAGVAAGTLVTGLALAGAEGLGVRAHAGADQALTFTLLLGAVALGLGGQPATGALLAGAAAALAALTATTRFTRRGRR